MLEAIDLSFMPREIELRAYRTTANVHVPQHVVGQREPHLGLVQEGSQQELAPASAKRDFW
jgi:hypothetical protein